ncbi:hypothetical protein [Mycoplasmopsis gallinarum]|uniref:DUF3137 domain-containing protein n=1 Tax=Mycoplasmopsis gallinarum TaxID=29557 RepID=A0A168RJA1_9BACT|nr:hypothetical protein [Mycoplasmopsis gallinarum]OAB49037.1 hypothetical protein MGALLINA_02060 [Mycoplasmopsis gallinarum]
MQKNFNEFKKENLDKLNEYIQKSVEEKRKETNKKGKILYYGLLTLFIIVILSAIAVLFVYSQAAYQNKSNVKLVQWLLYTVVIIFILFTIMTWSYKYLFIKKNTSNYQLLKPEDIYPELYKLANLNYVEEKENILNWAAESLENSILAQNEELTLATTTELINSENDNQDKWIIQNIIAQDQSKSYSKLFFEADIKSKQFKNSYQYGYSFPQNSVFGPVENADVLLCKKCNLVSTGKVSSVNTIRNIYEFAKEYDLLDREFGFVIQKETNKIYAWITLDRLLFEEQIDKEYAENILRDIFLIGNIQDIIMSLD